MRLIPVLVLAAGLLAGCAGSDNASSSSLPPIPAPPDVAAAPADAQRTGDNVASKVLKPGTGARHPRANSVVTVHYTGWTTDGKMFDSSVARGEPYTTPLDQVIPGWTEGVQMMVEGEKRRFWIPAKLAYEGMSGPQGTLVFDIELIKIVS
jgi:peptidylprolyl isomerase